VDCGAPANPKSRETFSQRYRERFGHAPTLSAAEAYDAVARSRFLDAQVRPNRARLCDALSQSPAFNVPRELFPLTTQAMTLPN